MNARLRATRTSGSAAPRFPIVGIGASAGGLDAFTLLLQHLPVDTGCGFVLVQHLSPQHESALPGLLARATAMPVVEAAEGMRVEPNHVYIIPPNATLGIARGVLTLQPRSKTPGPHRSIDHFFEALAHDQHAGAIGVILSGNASDGTLGLDSIRAEGGLTFAQDATARYDSMPRSAIAAGCVDFVLGPAPMAREIARVARHPALLRQSRLPDSTPDCVPDDVRPEPSRPHGTAPIPDPAVLPEGFATVLELLRQHTGVDFSLYKPPTLLRRITRRMILSQQESLVEYAAYLRANPSEFAPLFADVLINVTGFFRDSAAFEVLKRKIFPRLQTGQPAQPLRVWVLGCSTGQEAYSLAMAYAEMAADFPHGRRLQIFATDLSDAMLEKARHGFYPRGLVQNVSAERLQRFFTEEEGGYRIIKQLREQVVFARQNLISDPPFSRLDLISCRNLLIYLDAGLQQKAIPTFHYALNPGGFLFLGAAESIGPLANLFSTEFASHRIYGKKNSAAAFQLPVPARGGRRLPASRPPPALPGLRAGATELRGELAAQREADRITIGQYSPPAVLVDGARRILQFRGNTDPFLKPPAGKATFDLLKMAREGLLLPLRSALNQAERTGRRVARDGIATGPAGGAHEFVRFEVVPLRNVGEPCFLILFWTEKSASRQRQADPPAAPRRKSGRSLPDVTEELRETRQYLESMQEQFTTVHEELLASNEEAQSANEELQSLNEELETSKEELQSTNEELVTVNEEMAHRNTELALLNSDLTNLQESVNLAVVVLSRTLTVRRFSPRAGEQLGLTTADLHQPLERAWRRAGFPDVEDLAGRVMASQQEHQRETQDKSGRWHSIRLRPYVTSAGATDGVVVAVVDIHELKMTEQRISEEREHAEAIIRTVPNPLVILTADLRCQFANDAFHRVFQLAPADIRGQPLFAMDGASWDVPRLRHLLEDIIPRNSFFDGFELTHTFPRLGARSLLIDARVLNERGGKPKEILMGIQDVTEVLAFQVGLRRSELRYRRLFEAAQDGVLLIDPGSGRIVDANPYMTALLGYSHDELCGRGLAELRDETTSGEVAAALLHQLATPGATQTAELFLRNKHGERCEVEISATHYHEREDSIIQCNLRDITERKRTARRLKEKARLLDLTNDAIIVRNLGDNVTLWNKGAEKLFGWTAAEAIGKHLHTLLQTEFPRPMAEIVALLEREQRYSGEVTQIARDGHRVPSLCRWVLDRETDSILTTYTDLSEFQALQEQLSAGEERYRTLFNSIDEGFCVIEVLFDERGQPADYLFLETNPSFEIQSGLAGVAGKRMRELKPGHESHWFQVYGQVALSGESVRFEGEASQLHRWFDVYAVRVGEPAQHRVAVLFTDITNRKRTEASLRQAQQDLANRAGQLEALVAARTLELTSTNTQLEAFVYSIAHDLRAPLRAMQTFAGMLLEEIGQISSPARDYAMRIKKSAEFLDALLRDLLAYSRISQEQAAFVPVPLGEVIRTVLSLCGPDLQRTGAQVEVADDWPLVLGHEPTLTQVLLNLVGNALKFVREGATPVLRLSWESREDRVRVWVEDNGIGIAPAYHDQIFRLFSRLNGGKFAGTGVGLAIVQKAILRMGGTLGIDSAVGHGSRFWFELPRGTEGSNGGSAATRP